MACSECESPCERLFVFLHGPAVNCRLIQSVTPPTHRASWEGLQQTPATWSAADNGWVDALTNWLS